MSPRRKEIGAAVSALVSYALRAPASGRVSWLAHDLANGPLWGACNGGECDLGAPCFRHGNLFTIAARLVARAQRAA